MEHTNWLSIVISSLTPSIVGFIYYHPKLFGTAWMKSLGFTEEDLKKGNMAVTMIVAIAMSFLLSIFLINFNNSTGQEGQFDTFLHGAWHGMVTAVVVAIPVLVTNGLFEKKNYRNLLINVLYWLITISLMGGILDAMNHWPNG